MQMGRGNDRSCFFTYRQSPTFKAQGAQWLAQGLLETQSMFKMRRSMQARSL